MISFAKINKFYCRFKGQFAEKVADCEGQCSDSYLNGSTVNVNVFQILTF